MKLKSIYSFLGYSLITLCTSLVVVVCAVDLLDSVEYSDKALMYFGLFISLGFVIWHFRKISKENLNLSSIFGLFGQLCIVFFIFVFVVFGHKSPKDKIFFQEMDMISNSELNPELRMARCELTLRENKNKNSFLIKDIETACRRMLLDVSRQSYLNIIPALDLITRLDQHNQVNVKSDYTALRLCLIAESGQVDRAVMIAERVQLHKMAQNIKETGHCKGFIKRDVASEL